MDLVSQTPRPRGRGRPLFAEEHSFEIVLSKQFSACFLTTELVAGQSSLEIHSFIAEQHEHRKDSWTLSHGIQKGTADGGWQKKSLLNPRHFATLSSIL